MVATKGKKIGKKMKKKIAIGFIIVTAVVGVAISAYQFGLSRRSAEIETLKSERQAAETSYATSLEAVNNERNRALNDFATAWERGFLLSITYV